MKLEPYVFLNGSCAEAIAFYETTLGARREMLMTFADMPPGSSPMPDLADSAKLVMHASLMIGEQRLMASDVPPGQPFEPMQGVSLSLSFTTVEEARRIYEALSAGGAVQMPLSATFWSQAFAMFSDRFGIRWMINGPAVEGA